MRTTLALLLAPLVVACSADTTDGDAVDTDTFEVPEGAVDLRQDFPEPASDDAVVIRGTPLVIGPYEEKQYCLYTTWDGPEVGIHAQETYQAKFGHHFLVAGTTTTAREVPDGTVVDCTEAASDAMSSFDPLMAGGTIADANGHGELTLPEGMASRMVAGQRLIFQSHYVNTSADTIVVQDEAQFDVVPSEEVDVWAATYTHTEVDLAIPTGVSSYEFSCTFDRDYTLLFMTGHMHEWGSHYKIEHTNAEGGPVTLYDIDWDPIMRDVPVYADLAGGSMDVKAGDTFKTTCTWDNDTNEVLGFPHEMCATFGMLHPSTTAVICEYQAK